MPTRSPVDAFAHAVKLLAGRERSRAQLEASLRGRGYEDAEIVAALARLEELGYLNDVRVARHRAREGLEQGRGTAEVVRRLVATGLDADLASEAVSLASAELGHDDEASARALVKGRHLEGVRAARFLAGRGFSEDVIRRVVDLGD